MVTVVDSVDQLVNYRHLVTLPDGLRVLIRPLVPKDSESLVALFANLPAEETASFRNKVNQPGLVAGWAEHPQYDKVFPLVAVVGDHIVGNCSLHLGSGYTRHVGEVRIFLAREYRRRGIGSAMIKSHLEIARKLGLHQVIAEIVETRPQVIHAFERLGFERQFAWKDLFMTPEGETLDMVVLVNYLKRPGETF